MVSPLNLYATKVFSEQPISLWALDEPVGYLSLITEDMQNLNSGWITGGVSGIVDATTDVLFNEKPPAAPFQDIFVNGVIEDAANPGLISFESSSPVASTSFSQDLGSFAIGFYAFTFDRTVQARLGYRYTKPNEEEVYEVIRLVNVPSSRQWAFISETFSMPESFESISFYVELFYQATEIEYQVAINGLSVGQWSEEFHTNSLGVFPQQLPEDVPISGFGVLAQPYGLQGKSGYYIVHENSLCALNSGMPLVFGSDSSTELRPNPEGPSLIIPAEGLFGDAARYQSRTFEVWISVQSNSMVARRIFGPLTTDDGVYVEKHSIKLKIGNSIGSYPIGYWDRPMLLDLRMTETSASLLINGEQVITLEVSADSITYQSESEDWLGFYSYDEDVPRIRIEAPSIYPYEVPAIVAKRRFVYGQGVDFPTNIKGLNNSAITYIDYAMSNYAKNFLYPQVGPWSGGIGENIVKGARALTLPEYKLPITKFNNKSNSDWLIDSYSANQNKISFRPNSSWGDTEGYLYFEKLGLLREDVKAFYALFDPVESGSRQELFSLENTSTGATMSIYIYDNSIHYSIAKLGALENIFYSAPIEDQLSPIMAGLDITLASRYFSSSIGSFFANKQSIKLYVGGTKLLQNTFTGAIKKIGLMSSRNLGKAKLFYNRAGLPIDSYNLNIGNMSYEDSIDNTIFGNDSEFWDLVTPEITASSLLEERNNRESHVATYTVVPKIFLGSYSLDISLDSYWESYLPLSYFGTYVKDQAGDPYFQLDFLQFNVGYPKFNIIENEKYSTKDVPVKTYISFQYLKSGANASYFSFVNTQSLDKSGVIRPRGEWINTKYEVLDDTVIYPPLGAAIENLAIVFHIEIQSDSADDKIEISSLGVASQALGYSPNKISTRFGTSIIPYKKSGSYFDYKNVEPFSIYKKSSPYLYLTSNSGMRLRGNYNNHNRNGLSLPINTNKASFFKVDLIQAMIRYDEQEFPVSPVQIFEIQSVDEYIKFFLVADSNNRKRGQIYAIDDSTGRLKSGLVYYINGVPVKRPILNLSQWATLAISFGPALNFEFSVGAIRFTSPLLFNNVSYYQTTELDEVQRFAYRKWTAVRSGIDNPIDWGYWSGEAYNQNDQIYQATDGFSWQEVLFLSESDAVLPDGRVIYQQFTGTSSIIIDTSSVLRVTSDPASAYSELTWSTSVNTPA
jgi:hypothetical protein